MMIHKISLIKPLPASATSSGIAVSRGVKDITHANWFGGIYQDPKNFFANMAVDPESWLRIYPEFELPEDQKKAWLADRTGAVVGIETAEALRLEDRRPRAAAGRDLPRPDGGPWEFTIDGIYDRASRASTRPSSSSTTTTSTRRSRPAYGHDRSAGT